MWVRAWLKRWQWRFHESERFGQPLPLFYRVNAKKYLKSKVNRTLTLTMYHNSIYPSNPAKAKAIEWLENHLSDDDCRFLREKGYLIKRGHISGDLYVIAPYTLKRLHPVKNVFLLYEFCAHPVNIRYLTDGVEPIDHIGIFLEYVQYHEEVLLYKMPQSYMGILENDGTILNGNPVI